MSQMMSEPPVLAGALEAAGICIAAGAPGAEAAAGLAGTEEETAGGDAALGASSATSAKAMTEPMDTLSPTLSRSSLTTPDWFAGISMLALSVSIVIKDCSRDRKSVV